MLLKSGFGTICQANIKVFAMISQVAYSILYSWKAIGCRTSKNKGIINII